MQQEQTFIPNDQPSESAFLQGKLQKLQNKKQQSEFIEKLQTILQDPECARDLCWTPCGTQIFVRDPVSIAKNILPKYFNHSKYSTLIRQLNYYGFKKVPSKSGLHIYTHPCFQQGKPELISLIQRVKNKKESKKQEIEAVLPTKADIRKPGITEHLLQQLAEAYATIAKLQQENEILRKQNQALELRVRKRLLLSHMNRIQNFVDCNGKNRQDLYVPQIQESGVTQSIQINSVQGANEIPNSKLVFGQNYPIESVKESDAQEPSSHQSKRKGIIFLGPHN